MRKTRLIFLCLLLSLPMTVVAHPHVFVDNHMAFEFDAKGFAGIQVTWVFDEMFSSGMQLDFDDGDGILSPKEISEIKAEAFDNLKKNGYFFRIQIDGTPFPVKFVADFTAKMQGRHLIYQFKVPCHVSAVASPKMINIRIDDETNYSSIMTRKTAISVQPASEAYFVQLTYEPAPYFLQLRLTEPMDSADLLFSQP